MDVVVVARVPTGQAFADQDRVVEVDHLDVARGSGAYRADERPRRAAVVDGHPVVPAPLTLALVATHDPDVDVHAALVRLVAGHDAPVLEADVSDRDGAEPSLPQRHGRAPARAGGRT